ncbi:MAG: BMP family ABC transporter substrate-binding protein [Ruminococcus sp.]|uniref:BMP family ABC transporter substrate-binding protein n=1 Tax=Ruminococcus sp. TaxID=41978 RepID=UPI002873CFFB|nr:BMP family ABC transporter substrate-binding protein [Ruminococcus sp.]MBQ3286059.1 BMP family ABC transporter substrate-binding protein [Ruminococcus sp.]
MQPELNYKEALKLGQKEVRARAAKNENTGLAVLDELIPPEQALSGVSLGVIQIPMWFIVGTKTAGRVNAFAPNFMPLLPESTEFAAKWESLYRSHMTEGIRESIKVYEYLNRYYVEEGNKRVSVLKYCGAYSIPADVTRIMPEKTDSEEVQLYLEYLEFNRYSKINFIEFSKRGSYRELLRAMGKPFDEYWSIDEQQRFSSTYYFFERAYNESGGGKLKTTVGDAMLSYIQIYGYSQLQNESEAQIRINLKKMWEEIALKEEDEAIELKTVPVEEKKQSVIAKVLPIAKPQKLKTAFVYDVPPEKSGWVSDHEMGRKHTQTVLGDKVETEVYICGGESNYPDVLEQAIGEGCRLIFTTSPRMLQASLRAAVEYPDVVIMNCSLNTSHRYVRTYYTRMYEVKFILGILAGSLTQSGRLGYVCDYPIFGQIAGINAFALGAQMANPRSKVYLEWSSVKGAKEAALSLNRQHIHLISSQDTARYSEDDRSSFGLSHIGSDKTDLLAVPVWKWGVYYEKLLRSVLDKTIKSEYVNTARALNYYWGMSAGVVDIEYAPALPLASRRYADFFRRSLISGAGKPFLTPFYSQSGEIVGARQNELNLEQIINMDYLVDNVVGSIPAYDALSDVGKATVDTVGVQKAKLKEDEKSGEQS